MGLCLGHQIPAGACRRLTRLLHPGIRTSSEDSWFGLGKALANNLILLTNIVMMLTALQSVQVLDFHGVRWYFKLLQTTVFGKTPTVLRLNRASLTILIVM